MRIVQIMGTSSGGVAQHVQQITMGLNEELAGTGEVQVASPSELLTRFSNVARHLPLEISDRPQRSDIKIVQQIRRIALGADVLHAHGLRAAALTALALQGRPRSKRPVFVATLHNLPVGSAKIQAISSVLERIVAHQADAVLGVSMDIVDRMAKLKAKNTARALVPAPALAQVMLSMDEVRENLGIKDGCKLLVTVARLAPQKGLDTLVQAAALFNADPDLDVHWVVAGDGPLLGSTQDQIDALDAPVTMLGRRSDIADLMNAADVVVSTAVWEGQPIAVQEALSLGAAIVATDAGGTREVTGTAAVITAIGDPGAMHDRIKELLESPAALSALRDRAQRRKDELPSLAAVLESLLSVYQIRR